MIKRLKKIRYGMYFLLLLFSFFFFLSFGSFTISLDILEASNLLYLYFSFYMLGVTLLISLEYYGYKWNERHEELIEILKEIRDNE